MENIDIKTLIEGIGDKINKTTLESKKLNERLDEIELKEKRINFSPQIEVKQKYFDGQKAARIWKCQTLASLKGETKSALEIAQEIYGRDKDFIKEVKSLMASDNAGIIIHEDYYSEILPLLYNKLSVMQLGARKIPMNNGNINISKLVQGSSFGYVGEARPAKASQPKFAKMRMSSKKGVVKVPISNDLLRSASADADRIVRDDMIFQMQLGMDWYALYGEGTEYSPLGIKNSKDVNRVKGTPTIDGDELYTQMVTPIKKANIPMRNLGWIFNPDVFGKLYNAKFANGMYMYRDELKQGTFHGIKFVETNQIETVGDNTDIFFGDFDQFFIGEQMGIEVKASEDATYMDINGIAQSAFDNDETVVKALMLHDFGIAYGKAFSVGTFSLK